MELNHYEEVRLEEMELDNGKLLFPCPCGDVFELLLDDLLRGEDVAQCPTCSLTIKVVYTTEERAHFLMHHGQSVPPMVAA